MCSGNDKKKKAREAQKRQEELNRQAAARQAELDRIAAQRQSVAAIQAQQQKQMEAQMIAFSNQQAAQVSRLQQQQDAKLAQLAADDVANRQRIQQETATKVAGIERAGNAAASSLRILGQESPAGPTATATDPKKRRKGAKATSASVSRGTGSTRGTNLSI